jgi:hypothetical protein
MKKLSSVLLALALFAGVSLVRGHEGHDEDAPGEKVELQTIKGEIVDLMCYLDHGATGDKHVKCARTCIESGGPVGIVTSDQKVYLVIGQHKPMNKELLPLAGKTVSLKGKVVERDGMKMIENAEILK